ncbi:MAG: bifunctional phosphopantothenoylcysteine decarboxylase/phosphopantothenate--cysteine ligase CoaBC [Acidobacteriota bacterium]
MSGSGAVNITGGRVVLVVTGSIAAYKACEVLRRLQDRGIEVRVAMTRSATEFVSALTFAALSGHRVLTDCFQDTESEPMAHIRWAERCQAFCVVPATADFLARMAAGIADDFASTLHLAVEAPVLVAPAMEDRMWAHPAVRQNLSTLRSRGVSIVDPATGALASGRQGPGRLAEPTVIVEAITGLLSIAEPIAFLAGRRVLVTAGPTREHLDPVRLLTNPSSGKMGFAMAEAARRHGAEVVLISGPSPLPDPVGVETVRVETASEMAAAVLDRAASVEAVVMAAAVADFRPLNPDGQKIKKLEAGRLMMELVPTGDILEQLASLPGERLVVGFAAETSEVEARAQEKMLRKGCDLMVANRVGVEGGGFESDTNEVVILDRLGGRRPVGPASKAQVAESIWQAVGDFRARRAAVSAPRQPA